MVLLWLLLHRDADLPSVSVVPAAACSLAPHLPMQVGWEAGRWCPIGGEEGRGVVWKWGVCHYAMCEPTCWALADAGAFSRPVERRSREPQ